MSGGEEIEHKITHNPDPGWVFVPDIASLSILDFALALEPGEYRITFLRAQHDELADKQITLLLGGGGIRFTVPESGCSYIGRIYVNYFRLPHFTPAEQLAYVGERFGEIFFINLYSGSLVGESGALDRAPRDERPEGSEKCTVKMAEWG